MISRTDPQWPDTKKWLLEKIEFRRSSLEAVGGTEADANVHRGFIQAYRSIITEVEPKFFEASSAASYHDR